MSTMTFPVTAGLLVRGSARREIERAAFACGLTVSVKESKGLLESLYMFEVEGDTAAVERFARALGKWADDQF